MITLFRKNGFFRLMIKLPKISRQWIELARLYERFWMNRPQSQPQRIPRKLHLVWLGSEVPAPVNALLEKWHAVHPGWTIKVWTDADVESFGMHNIAIFRTLSNYGAKSDLFRYEILYREGGVYIDTDFECIKSFEDFLCLSFFSGTGWAKKIEVFNGLFGCEPKHPFLKSVLDAIGLIRGDETDFGKIMEVTGPKFFTHVLFAYLKEHRAENIVVFPTEYFYAFPPKLRLEVRAYTHEAQNKVLSYATANSYCLHLWQTSWQKPAVSAEAKTQPL